MSLKYMRWISSTELRRDDENRNRLFGIAFVLIGFMTSSLAACSNDDRPAPKPTANPGAHVYSTIRILVSDPRIDDLQVDSEWVVGNLGCAPIIPPEGFARLQQVSTPEQVTRVDGGYQARLLEDRFQSDSCHWLNGGMYVSFIGRGREFASLAIGPNDFNNHRQHKLICTPPLEIDDHTYTGNCYLSERFAPQLEKTPGTFTATLDVVTSH